MSRPYEKLGAVVASARYLMTRSCQRMGLRIKSKGEKAIPRMPEKTTVMKNEIKPKSSGVENE